MKNGIYAISDAGFTINIKTKKGTKLEDEAVPNNSNFI